jgi:protein KRI1
MDLLSDEENGSHDLPSEQLRVNKVYASKYERSKRKIELAKAKELLENEGDEESDSETEDEDAELLSPDLDLQIITTINRIKRKDPSIYDPNKKWFQQTEETRETEIEKSEGKGKDKGKKTFKDLAREQLLEGDVDSDEGQDRNRRYRA